MTGTPTYVIGGERLDGGKSQEGLRERIEEIADRLLAAQAPDGRGACRQGRQTAAWTGCTGVVA